MESPRTLPVPTGDETKHTPTPWRCDFSRFSPEDEVRGMAIFGQGKHPEAQPIASQNYASGYRGAHADYTTAEIEANAAFIVRAVNTHDALVEALRAMTNRLTGMIESGDCGFWDSEGEETVIAARAALSLATGEDR